MPRRCGARPGGALGLGFVVLGSVLPTASHTGGLTLGWERFAALVADTPLPVYALGGRASADLGQAWRCGAHGIAMMRGAWPDRGALLRLRAGRRAFGIVGLFFDRYAVLLGGPGAEVDHLAALRAEWPPR